ncbi:MAG: LamG domain-containing protein [Bacteroidales bacterium]|nr:LamG domain-containing protein [Bacteroidales bacterium]MDD4385011.1 LamG domain-containing protein [Bacteroidales bacterium]MDY0198135.1 LamG domain-containing protein [Tenuifilaceae bacterium]
MKNKFKFFGMLLLGGLIFGSLALTSCKDDDPDPDPNAGKTDPSTIAATNLIAYFDFESQPAAGVAVPFTNNTITFGQKVGASSFVVGRRGNALKGSSSEAYLEYNITGNTALKTLSEFTLACWIKSPATTGGAAKIFAINGGDDFMGNLTLMQESQPEGDSLDMKLYLFDSESVWKGQDIRAQRKEFAGDLWFHMVGIYRMETSTIELWANGVKVAESVRYSDGDPDGEGPLPQPLLGPIKLGQNMTKIHFGAWPQQIDGTGADWMNYYNGMVDEFRIYNKALTEVEIKALYDAEITWIN